jgi:hypothetical protein
MVGLPDVALSCLHRDLRNGALRSALVKPDDKVTTTPLNSSNLHEQTVHHPYGRGVYGLVESYAAGHRFVWRADVDKCYPDAAALARATAPRADDTKPPERRRGPVNTHDWHSIDGEIARRCVDPETGRVQVPKKESAVVADMRTWCEKQGWAAPAVSEMSKAVRRMCAALRTVQK